VQSQNPPGPNPPGPPEPPDKTWISPRLRAKLDEPEEETPREGPPPWVGIVLAVLVIGGGAGLFTVMRSGAAKQKAEAERIARERAAVAAAESTANAARIDSMRAVAKAAADSLAKLGKGQPAGAAAGSRPASSGATAPSRAAAAPTESEPAAAEPAVVEKGPFGIDVGSFLAQERAASELAQLTTSTGLKGSVVAKDEGGGALYHVVLGSYSTRAAAVKRAESLFARGLVQQAVVVSLAP